MKQEGHFDLKAFHYRKDDLKDINNLLRQLSKKAKLLTKESLFELMRDRNIIIGVIRLRATRKIVSMASICFYKSPTGLKSHIEDVVTDEAYRGKGLAERILRVLINKARDRKADFIDLTSRPNRIAANALYKKLGLEKRDTNVYRLLLKKSPR